MFQKGRPPQEVSYKEEVLKIFPNAKFEKVNYGSFSMGAIYNDNKRISEPEKAAYKAWESAYYTHKNKTNLFQY